MLIGRETSNFPAPPAGRGHQDRAAGVTVNVRAQNGKPLPSSPRLRKQSLLRNARWSHRLRYPNASLHRLRKGQRCKVVALGFNHQPDRAARMDVEHALLNQMAFTAVSNQL